MGAYCFEMSKDQRAAWIERVEAEDKKPSATVYDWTAEVKKSRELQRRIDAGEDV